MSFNSTDGVRLAGYLWGQPGSTAVILTHSYPKTQRDWWPFAETLAQNGLLALTFDFRGYGESSGSKNIPLLDRDLEGAYNFLRQMSTPPTEVFLIGSSMGGIASLKLAQRIDVAGVIAVSAPIQFLGLEAGTLANVEEPKLFLATSGDGNYAELATTMYDQSRMPKELGIYPGDAHGEAMLASPSIGLTVRTRILEFVTAWRSTAAVVVDQALTPPASARDTGVVVNTYGCCRFVAQTFTAGLTGDLVGVNIDVLIDLYTHPLRVAIRAVSGGVPTPTILAEVTMGSSDAPLGQLITFSLPVQIVAEVKYAIVVDYPLAPPPGAGQGVWKGNSGDAYGRGGVYQSLDGTVWREIPDIDLDFRTHVRPRAAQLPGPTPTAPSPTPTPTPAATPSPTPTPTPTPFYIRFVQTRRVGAEPRQMAADRFSNVYVVIRDSHSVVNLTGVRGLTPGQGLCNGRLQYPEGVAVDAAGNIYVTDSSQCVQAFSSSGVFLRRYGANIVGSGPGQFNNPRAIAVDASGNVYVADTGNDRIQKFSNEGTFLAQWGSWGSGPGQLRSPHGIAVDSAGNVYVSDRDNHRIQKFNSNGTFLGQWGTEGRGDGQLLEPYGIAVDTAGNVYVVDFGNDRIQKFNPNGLFLGKWGTEGTGPGQFVNPWGIAIGPAGDVYVSDRFLSLVHRFSQQP